MRKSETKEVLEDNSYLKKIVKAIEPTERQKRKNKEQREKILNKLGGDSYFKVPPGLSIQVYQHGSASRHTMIRKSGGEMYDLDLLIIANPPSQGKTKENDKPSIQPQSVLQRLKERLQKIYPGLKIQQDFPCIIAKHSDNYTIEFLPVVYIENNKKGNEKEFCIPSTRKEWMKFQPLAFNQIVSDLNKEFSGLVVSVIKLMKHWNNISLGHKKIRSFLLEYLVVAAFKELKKEGKNNLTIYEYTVYVFEKLEKWIENPNLKSIILSGAFFAIIVATTGLGLFAIFLSFLAGSALGDWLSPFSPSVKDGEGFLDHEYVENEKKQKEVLKVIKKSYELIRSQKIEDVKTVFPMP